VVECCIKTVLSIDNLCDLTACYLQNHFQMPFANYTVYERMLCIHNVSKLLPTFQTYSV
jgi:hypothetical protein